MTRWILGLLLTGCILVAGGPAAKAAPPEPLKKLHILMVFDTADEDLGKSLWKDLKRLSKLWQVTIPGSRYEVKVLVTREPSAEDNVDLKALRAVKVAQVGDAIFAHYKALQGKVRPDDGLLFYFGGHGAMNDKLGHVFKMHSGRDVVRRHVRAAMEKCKAGLTVLLSDCCSTKEKWLGNKDNIDPGIREAFLDPRPPVKHLFFQSRGVVDVTAAAENEAAWSDDENGGLFTRSLARMLTKKVEELDLNKDGFITWQEFFPQLQNETKYFFKEWTIKMKARHPDAHIRAEKQVPYAFFLGKQATYAVIELENAKAEPVKYRYRWNRKDDWLEWTLKPKESRVHILMLGDNDDLPKLEVVREGRTRSISLTPVRWAQDRAPKNLRKGAYEIRP